MSTRNPFVPGAAGIIFPDTVEEIDALAADMQAYIGRTAIAADGLPSVIALLEELEWHRSDVLRRGACGSIRVAKA
jgi:hypothetical protein